MSAQSSMNAITGSITGGIVAAAKISESVNKKDNEPKVEKAKEGKDIKMAQKARKEVQQKVNAIYANKELSNKAKTRRVGKILDEYKGGE